MFRLFLQSVTWPQKPRAHLSDWFYPVKTDPLKDTSGEEILSELEYLRTLTVEQRFRRLVEWCTLLNRIANRHESNRNAAKMTKRL